MCIRDRPKASALVGTTRAIRARWKLSSANASVATTGAILMSNGIARQCKRHKAERPIENLSRSPVTM